MEKCHLCKKSIKQGSLSWWVTVYSEQPQLYLSIQYPVDWYVCDTCVVDVIELLKHFELEKVNKKGEGKIKVLEGV